MPEIAFSRFLGLLIFVLALLPSEALARSNQSAEGYALASLVIETAAGKRHRFRVELAISPEERARGLMYRKHLPAGEGMLFLFPESWPAVMWMRNTFISLDMLFIDGEGRVLQIAEKTQPLSDEIIAAKVPVTAVLELPGGTVARLGLAPGDRILHEAFAPQE